MPAMVGFRASAPTNGRTSTNSKQAASARSCQALRVKAETAE